MDISYVYGYEIKFADNSGKTTNFFPRSTKEEAQFALNEALEYFSENFPGKEVGETKITVFPRK